MAVCDIDRCEARTKRRGKDRQCAQRSIVMVGGKQYCYYHNPSDPKKFGDGYLKHAKQLTTTRRPR